MKEFISLSFSLLMLPIVQRDNLQSKHAKLMPAFLSFFMKYVFRQL